MTSLELQTESLTVLPQRLETIHVGDPGSSQRMSIVQANSNHLRGGRCALSLVCTQSNAQSNSVQAAGQTVPSSAGTGAADIFRGLLGGLH